MAAALLKEPISSSSVGTTSVVCKATSVHQTDVPMRAADVGCASLVEESSNRYGMETQPPAFDAGISEPLLNDDWTSPDAEVCESEKGFCLQETWAPVAPITFADMVLSGLTSTVAEMPSSCSLPMPISVEDRLAALGTPSSFADEDRFADGFSAVGSAPCLHVAPAEQHCQEHGPCTSIGMLRRNIAAMRSQFDVASPCVASITSPSTNVSAPSPDGEGKKSRHQSSKRRKKKSSSYPLK